jgi:hypothetical protein
MADKETAPVAGAPTFPSDPPVVEQPAPPVTEPVVEPPVAEVTEPVTEPPVADVTEPAAESAAEPVVEDAEPFIPEPGFGQGDKILPLEEVAPVAGFVPEPGFGDPVEAPAPADTPQDGSLALRHPSVEADATEINADLAATLIPMSHPNGGTCDRYESDADGNILVPASEAAAMFAFGFAVVADA